MNYDDKDIDILLEKWYDAKKELSALEKKVENYKKFAERIMDKENINNLSNDKYNLIKREMNRTVLAKDDVPREIWHKYSKNISYSMFVLRKKKE